MQDQPDPLNKKITKISYIHSKGEIFKKNFIFLPGNKNLEKKICILLKQKFWPTLWKNPEFSYIFFLNNVLN